jgi:hypothetical protein
MNYSFFLAMTLYPDVQARAQAEIDSVIGPSRLPKFADRANLPYVNALVLEVLRWHQVLPQSLPRKLREDDVYEGYLIPKGAIIIPNIWYARHQWFISSQILLLNDTTGVCFMTRRYTKIHLNSALSVSWGLRLSQTQRKSALVLVVGKQFSPKFILVYIPDLFFPLFPVKGFAPENTSEDQASFSLARCRWPRWRSLRLLTKTVVLLCRPLRSLLESMCKLFH